MLNTIGWYCIRIVVTLAVVWTIQNVIHKDGYYVNFDTLLICAVLVIVGVRFWMPRQHKGLEEK
jgi:hypothetical protein